MISITEFSCPVDRIHSGRSNSKLMLVFGKSVGNISCNHSDFAEKSISIILIAAARSSSLSIEKSKVEISPKLEPSIFSIIFDI